VGGAQRIGSPAAGFGETTSSEIIVSSKWPPQTRAEGGQVEPVLGSIYAHIPFYL